MAVVIRIPWVSCRAYDLSQSNGLQAWNQVLVANRRVDALIETLTSMRRYGFDPERPTPSEPEAIPEEGLDDVIQEAIEELAVPGEPLYRDLVRQAYREIGKNPDPEEVAKIISAGADTEGM